MHRVEKQVLRRKIGVGRRCVSMRHDDSSLGYREESGEPGGERMRLGEKGFVWKKDIKILYIVQKVGNKC